jgi:Na+/H+ antiporter NhaA
MLRPDMIFSYWIYLWYIIYVFKLTKYSPKFALGLGIIDNIIMLFMMIVFGTNKKSIGWFIFVNTMIKVIPFYTLRKGRIQTTDLYFTAGLFIVFIIWLHINRESLSGNVKLIHDSLLYNKNETPFMSLIKKMENNYKNLKIVL